MWPFDQICGLMWRLTRPQMPDLVVDDAGFSICRAGHVIDRCRWDAIVRVVAFKRDRGMHDEICLDVDIGRQSGSIYVSEEFGGYPQFVEAMEKRLGVNHEWWGAVVFPAFEENATTVYQRVKATEPGGATPS